MNVSHLLLVIFLTHILLNDVQLKIHRLMANTASMAVLSFANLAVPFSLIGVRVHVSNSIGGIIVSPFGPSAITEPLPFTAVLLFPPNAGFSEGSRSPDSRHQSAANAAWVDLHEVDSSLKQEIKKSYTSSHVVGLLLKVTSASSPIRPGLHKPHGASSVSA